MRKLLKTFFFVITITGTMLIFNYCEDSAADSSSGDGESITEN